jgi:tRNA/tmRNA/rRNA uracil-C5-methylase (TrmA/RlmC/RlmD family)
MGRRFPEITGFGVEFEPDSVARALASIEAAGLSNRITIEHGDVHDVGHEGEIFLASSSTRSTCCRTRWPPCGPPGPR